MAHRVETLAGGTRVLTTAAHPVTADSLLLAAFCPLAPGISVCDLGSGGGILLLALADRGHTGPATGVELDPDGAALLEAAARENGLSHITAVQGDLREFKTARPFDMVVANPPWFTTGRRAQSPQRATARHQGQATVAQVAAAARRLLKDGGRLCLCWPPNQLPGLFAALAENTLAPRRLQLVRHSPGHPPWLALLEARKGGGEDLRIEPDLYKT